LKNIPYHLIKAILSCSYFDFFYNIYSFIKNPLSKHICSLFNLMCSCQIYARARVRTSATLLIHLKKWILVTRLLDKKKDLNMWNYWGSTSIANVLSSTILLRRKDHCEGSTSTRTEHQAQLCYFLDLHWTYHYLFFFFFFKLSWCMHGCCYSWMSYMNAIYLCIDKHFCILSLY